jgi:hypothetical protein
MTKKTANDKAGAKAKKLKDLSGLKGNAAAVKGGVLP